MIIDGLDNSVLLVFLIIMGFILYIFWNILKFIMEKRERDRSEFPLLDYNNNNQRDSDLYFGVGVHEDCAICTERIKYKIELDCRHCFCGNCIMDYYESLRPSNLKCPLCRSNIRLINTLNLQRTNQTSAFYDKIIKYNHKNLSGYNYVYKT